jgi:N-acetylmuramoyl-L-alanine amidase
MGRGRRRLAALAAAFALAAAPGAGGASALSARAVSLENGASGARLTVLFDAAAAPAAGPRSFTLDDPPRLVLDLPETLWRVDGPVAAAGAGLARQARFGLAKPGTSRIVVDLAGPARLARTRLSPGEGGLALEVDLAPSDAARFAAFAGWPADAAPAPRASPADAGVFRVALDPGHGGVDPGAVRGGVREKDVTLAFSLALAGLLEAAGLEVVLTRRDDRFVALRDRVELARAAGADLFLSVHADALREGRASGASVYTLSARASDADAAALAARENQVDLIAGPDFAAEGADVARALIDLVQRETMSASRRFGAALVDALGRRVPVLEGQPLRAAGFRVLKAPDVPSALLELGFLSSDADRARLIDPAWRAEAAAAVAGAIAAWAADALATRAAPSPAP